MSSNKSDQSKQRLEVITFTTDVCEDSVGRMITYASEAINRQTDSMILMISSSGGDLPAAFTAYNFLLTLPLKVTTYNIGNIESSSNLIFLAGQRRVASPTSQFMLHGISSPANSFTRSEIMAQGDRLELDIKRYAEVFRSRTTDCAVQLEIELCLSGNTRYLSAREAYEAGIVNSPDEGVIIPEEARWRNVC